MELRLDTSSPFSTLMIVGNIGLNEIEQFEDTLSGLVRTAAVKRLLIDCSALEGWDDSAISSLVNFIREVTREEDRRVAVFGLNAHVKSGLDRLGLTDILTSHDSRDAAVDAITD